MSWILGVVFLALAACTGADSPAEEPAREDEAPMDAHFEFLTPDETGIAFSNIIKETFTNNIMVNSYLYNGGGVAVIDVNNDNLPDLYFTATQEPNKLFLNKGNLRFEDITERAGVSAQGGNKTGVTVVDINADGWQDLYVCRSGMEPTDERANLLYINNGDQTFTERAAEYGLADRSASNHANFFDFDLDGDLDVYVLNHPVAFSEVNRISAQAVGDEYVRNTEPRDEWESDKLFRNDGNGKFTDISNQAGIRNRAWGLSVTVSYFNDDNYPDIFVGNDYIEPDLLYINNQDGTFSVETEKYFRHMSNHTMGVDIADINNDGRVDIAAADMLAEDNQRQKELMTTMMVDRYNALVQYHYGHQIMRNVLQVNTGAVPADGATYSDIGVLAGVSNTDWSWSVLLADFNNDALKDLYVTNGYMRDISNLDYMSYTVDSVMRIGGLNTKNFESIDEYLNLIPSTPLKNYMFMNVDGINFRNVSDEWGMGQESYSNGSAYADLDGDGDLEVIVNQIAGDALVYKNLSAEQKRGNWLQVAVTGGKDNPDAVGTRVRIHYSDGKLQYQEITPTRGFFSSSQHLLHFGLGSVERIDRVEAFWPDGKLLLVLEGVELNQRLTLDRSKAKPGEWQIIVPKTEVFRTASNIGIDFKHVEDDFVDFLRERMLPHKFSNLGPTLSVADVNGDNLDDIFIGGAKDQPGALYVQQAGGTFVRMSQDTWTEDAIFEDMGSTFFDADGDGDNDLYVVSGGSTDNAGSRNYQDRLYYNDGNGNFTKASFGVLPVITESGSRVVAYDYDGDGDQDLFIGGLVTPGFYPKAPMTCLLENRDGKFEDVCEQVAPGLNKIGMINDLVFADLDGDGNKELIVAGEWLPITVFEVRNGKLEDVTSRYGLENTSGWWNCVEVADLDGDGDADIVGGNMGLNSRLKASPEEPLRLYAKDFDNNGSIDPVMAYYNDGRLYPLAMRDMIIKQMPILKKKFVFNRDYGNATMEEVFSKAELESAEQFSAVMFETGWFENQDGRFVFHELPIEVQTAPCNAILIEDFNKDGSVDLLLAGNSSSPEVETGRYDAGNGVLLYGDGKGTFKPVSNQVSGFWATKEARDLAKVVRADGTSLFIVANNNDSVDVYVQ